MKNYFLITLFSVLYINSGVSQELTPPIQNFSSVQYGAASQNWDIAVDENGIIYTANHQGLLAYDGQNWELFPLRSGSIIRSVYPTGKRIYTGSYKEFGYWSRDNRGEMQYTSLIPLLKENSMKSEEIWQILSFQDKIYFRSFGAVYSYDGSKVLKIVDVVSNEMLIHQDKLILAVGKRGLYYLNDNGDLTALPGQEIFQGKTIIDAESIGDSLLIGTREALFLFNGTKSKLYEDRVLNDLLKKYELNNILHLDNNDLLLGTVKNGIIHYEAASKTLQILNRINGLQNNTVLSMVRRNGKIWLGLDNGIDVINLDAPVRFYTDDTGELGAVYDMSVYNETLYLGSNTGVYYFKDNELRLVEGAEGHCWNLEVIDGILYSNHNTGIYRIFNNKFFPVENRTGTFDMFKPPGGPGKIFIGTYTGISTYEPVNNALTEYEDVNFPVKKILFENDGIIWATHPYEGVYRIGIGETYNKSIFLNKINAAGELDYRSEVVKINNQIAIHQNNRWYRYNSFLDSLEVFPELEEFNDFRMLLEDRDYYWLTGTTKNSLLYTNFKETRIHLSLKELNHRLVKGNENVVKLNDSVFYVTLSDGFAQVELPKLLEFKTREYVSTPLIKSLADSEGKRNLTGKQEISYKKAREIRFAVGLPDSDAVDFFYELKGSSSQKGKVENGEIVFQNLSMGKYDLNLFATSAQGLNSNKASMAFFINPPWYLSRTVQFIYVLLILTIIGIVYWVNKMKLRKHQLILEQKFKKEHQERLNNLEKERLMSEITSKRKELANTTMIAARKNEVLMEILGELNKDKDKFSNQFRIKNIITKINQAIKNKDEWMVFETNFNEVHEDFFKDLLAKYPKLTNRDLKLCAYLKMNLTSKEIAPLMGISVRGVEVHRYRLRKKINVDNSENLTNWLLVNF